MIFQSEQRIQILSANRITLFTQEKETLKKSCEGCVYEARHPHPQIYPKPLPPPLPPLLPPLQFPKLRGFGELYKGPNRISCGFGELHKGPNKKITLSAGALP